MDIKDFILVGGGLLIAAVVAHGFWIAWRERRQDLRIDIKPDLIPEAVDDIERLRGELPNGGARVAKALAVDPLQVAFDLDGELLHQHPSAVSPDPVSAVEPVISQPSVAADPDPGQEIEQIDDSDYQFSYTDSVRDTAASAGKGRNRGDKARVDQPGDVSIEAPGADPETREAVADEIEDRIEERHEPALSETPGAANPQSQARPRVREVAMPDPIVADRPRRSRRAAERKAAEAREPQEPVRAQDVVDKPRPAVEELIVMNVLAAAPYTGDELFTVLRSCGLKFGEMNIFRRVEPLTKVVNYSIASAVEPGTFDMADMEAIRCPGLCLFMQLPGPEDPVAVFEEMLSVARSVTGTLGGEIKDEQRNVMTPQTVEHYRQRILDFSRRRMSKRA